jgi:hypothetical protein
LLLVAVAEVAEILCLHLVAEQVETVGVETVLLFQVRQILLEYQTLVVILVVLV